MRSTTGRNLNISPLLCEIAWTNGYFGRRILVGIPDDTSGLENVFTYSKFFTRNLNFNAFNKIQKLTGLVCLESLYQSIENGLEKYFTGQKCFSKKPAALEF